MISVERLLFIVLLHIWTQIACYGQVGHIDTLIERYHTSHNFNGALLIGQNGKIDCLKYVGLANRQDSVKYSSKSKFHIFSVSKTFTAVLIMQLYEQGKIHLDSSIAAYYPDYKGEAANKATIRDLLTYSGGRDNKEMREISEAYNSTIWPLDTFIARYCSEALVSTPGTEFKYNNGDFIILGKIVEILYRLPFQKVLEQKILRPLKMTDTGYLHHDDVIAHLDQAYFHHDTNPVVFTKPTNYYIDNYFSAGAMYSTPQDLFLFDRALFSNKLLKKETVQLMLASYAHLGDVGFGFWIYSKEIDQKSYLIAERQGYGYGHHANWVHVIDKNITLILLSNTNTVDLNNMRWEILSRFLKNSDKKM